MKSYFVHLGRKVKGLAASRLLLAVFLCCYLALPAWSQAGTISTVAGAGTAGYDPPGDGGPATLALLNKPWSTAVDGSGNLYIADAYNHSIRHVTPGADGVVNGAADETITTVAGNGVKTNITTNPLGDGGLATVASLNTPLGVAVDGNGNLYIADTYNSRIRIVTPGTDGVVNGAADEIIGTLAGSDSLVNKPFGIAFDAAGNLYIVDTYNYYVRKWTPGADGVVNGGADEIITNVAGTGARTGSLGGEGGDPDDDLANSLKWPANVAVDASGVIYISDRGNNR